MLKRKFFNNAEFKLAAPMPPSGGSGNSLVAVDRSIAAANLDGLVDGSKLYFTAATISDPSMPGVNEIVYITYYDEDEGQHEVEVIRAREGTQEQSWPAGASVGCRLTAGTLDAVAGSAIHSRASASLSLNNGDNFYASFPLGELLPIHDAWSIGGMPVMAARGWMDDINGSLLNPSVEAVGYGPVVELGTAPDYNPSNTYYPGELARDPSSPFYTYSRTRSVGYGLIGFGDSPEWARFAPETDNDIIGWPRIGRDDVWFYPTEIGFICDRYTATGVPSVTVKEVDRVGTVVGSDLVTAKALTGVGARRRVVLSTDITRGVNGFHFVRATAASGGSCQGRFYWKGMFVATNTAQSFSLTSPIDGNE